MQCEGKEPDGAKHLVGKEEAVGGVQGTGGELGGSERLGEKSDTGDDEGPWGRGGEPVHGNGVGQPAGAASCSSGKDGGERGNSSEITGGEDEEVQCGSEVPGGVDDMVGEAQRPGNMQGNGDKLGVVKPMAGGGNGWYAHGTGTEVAGSGAMSCAGQETEAVGGQEGGGTGGTESFAGQASGESGGETCVKADGREKYEKDGNICAVMGGEDHTGSQRENNSEFGGHESGHKQEDVLPEREEGSFGDDVGAGSKGSGKAENEGGSGKGKDACTALGVA